MIFHTLPSVTLALALSSFALAQDLSAYPSCSQTCLAEQTTKSSCYSSNTQLAQQVACLCKDPSYLSGTTKCVQAACSPADGQKAFQVGQGICQQAGVSPAQYSSLALGAGATAAAANPSASNGASNTTATGSAGSMMTSASTSSPSSTSGGSDASGTASQAQASSTGAAGGRKELVAGIAAAGWVGILGVALGGL
ncbi:MAG: hypothetical protein Q9227_008131 [Pyrenula ochraceoflavens]